MKRETIIGTMPDNQITLSKRICMASDGYQFVTRRRDLPRLGEGGEKINHGLNKLKELWLLSTK